MKKIIENIAYDLLAACLCVPRNEIRKRVKLTDRLVKDLHIDSDDITSWALKLEKQLNIKAPPRAWLKVKTMQDAINLMNERQAANDINKKTIKGKAEEKDDDKKMLKLKKELIAALLNDGRPRKRAMEIMFHMTDWIGELEAISAMYADPEKFSKEDIANILLNFVIHAPNHIARAAELMGYPIANIFSNNES